MDACNEKVDVLKIPFWPFLGGEQGEYFFSLFYQHPVYYNYSGNYWEIKYQIIKKLLQQIR